MTHDQNIDRHFGGRIYRVLSGMFGLFLMGVGIYIVFYGVVDPLIRIGAGLVIVLFGAETVWAANRSRQSWLSKLGPVL